MAQLPEKIRRQAYQAFFNTRDGQIILADFVFQAQASDVSEARLLGRADIVVRIERQRHIVKEQEKEPEDE